MGEATIVLVIQEEKDFKASGYDEYTDYKAAKMQAIRRSIHPVPPELSSSPSTPPKQSHGEGALHESSFLPVEKAVATPQRTSTPMPLPVSL